MTDSPLTAIPLIVVGILLVVVGLSAVLAGYSQMQAAQEWESGGMIIEDTDTGQCYRVGGGRDRDIPCENPHKGGGWVMVVGIVVVILGGTAIYYGTQ